MRRQMIAIFAILMALGAAPAQAQFSPRGILNMMTRPLRGVLGHFRGRHHHRHRTAHEARRAGPDKIAGTKVGANERQPGPEARRESDRLNAYDNVLGYAFWPGAYARDLNRYGYGAIAVAIAGALPAAPATTGSAEQAPQPAAADNPASVCQDADGATGTWLTSRIEQALGPDAAQNRNFEALRATVSEGAKTIQASCQAPEPQSPRKRLAALTKRLWAVHEAGVLARQPVKVFYATLTPAQRAKLDGAAAPASNAKLADRQRDCAAQSAGMTGRLLRQIRRAVKPTQAQQASLQKLQRTSAQMEKLLLAACTQPVPDDPLARLDAANARLVAMTMAATRMEVALNEFYAALDSRQQAQFASLGR